MDYDTNSTPLLLNIVENDMNKLIEDKRIYDASITELENIIDTINYKEPSSILQIKQKFNVIENKMKDMYDIIHSIKNFMKDNEKNKLKKIQNISDSINKKFINANKKFQSAIKNAQIDIQEQISSNSTSSNTEDLNNNENEIEMEMETNTNSSNKNKKKLEQLLNAKKEYEQIYDLTLKLNQLSKDIANSCNEDEKKIEYIEDNLIEFEDNIKKADIEIDKFEEKSKTNKSFYVKIALILIIIIGILIGLVYYNSGNNNKTNKNNVV